MSNAVSALNGAAYVDGIVDISEAGLRGMLSLRGDLSGAAVAKAVSAVGGTLPAQRRIETRGDVSTAWMSPDELLIMCAYAAAPAKCAAMQDALGDAHALVVNVSDARAVFRVTGPQTRDVIAKLAPVDLALGSFPVGSFRRTRLAQVAAAFHMADAETCEIVCFRSVAQYMFDLLKRAAAPGSEVYFHK